MKEYMKPTMPPLPRSKAMTAITALITRTQIEIERAKGLTLTTEALKYLLEKKIELKAYLDAQLCIELAERE